MTNSNRERINVMNYETVLFIKCEGRLFFYVPSAMIVSDLRACYDNVGNVEM